MFNVNLIKKYFDIKNISYDDDVLLSIIEDTNKNVSLSPSEKIKYLVEKCCKGDFRVSQVPIAEATEISFPGLMFHELRWVLISDESEDSFIAECFETGIELKIPKSSLPITVVMWIDEVKESNPESSLASDVNVSIKSIIFEALLVDKRWIRDICLATVLVNIFAVITSLFAMQVYDRVVPTLAFSTLYSLLAGMSLIYLTDFTLKITRSRLLDKNASVIDKYLSAHVFDHLLNAQLDKLPRQLGTLTAQITGLDGIRQFFTSSIVFALIDLPFAILFLFTMYAIAGPVAFVYATFLIISLIIGINAQFRSAKVSKEITQRSNEKIGILVDTIRGLETIRSSGSERHFEKNWRDIVTTTSNTGLVQKKINTIATSVSQTLGQVSYASAILLGVHSIASGDMTMGSMIACSILGGRVLGPVGQAVGYLIQYEGVKQSATLVDSFLNIPVNREINEKSIFPHVKPKNLLVESLEFAYEGASTPQVSIDNIEFKSGDRVAILGGIGSGKSTLLKMLAGLVKPTRGRIRINGIDLWQLDPYFVSNHFSYLPQSPDLFRGSFKDNLILGKNASDSSLIDTINALSLENIYEQNDKGLEMEIHEGGSGLSGGQKQMVGIGRVFINSPTIWLLDEPTSSLDNRTQEVVAKALKEKVKPNDILIFATHNLSLAKDLSNRVIVLEKGKVLKDARANQIEMRKKNAAVS